MKFIGQAQLVGSLLLVEGPTRNIIIESEVGSLTEACEIMLALSKKPGLKISPVVRKQIRKPSKTGWPIR